MTNRSENTLASTPEKAQGLSKSKVILLGVVIGVLAFVVALVCINIALPGQDDLDPDLDYGYVYSGAKSESVPFVKAASSEDTTLLFGSSELSTPASVIPQVPAEVFGMNDLGVDLMLIGEAYDQSLWQAMAAAAHGESIQNKKAIIIVSPTWFEDEGIDPETFKLRFSYELYRAFCANPDISESSKEYVAQRLQELGIDHMTIDAGLSRSPVAYLNDLILSSIEDLQIRKALLEVRDRGLARGEDQTEVDLDIDALMEQAIVDAESSCTNNDWGMDDDFYANNLEGRLDRLKGSQVGEHFSNQEEFQDFSFLLKVCKEVGLEPLVIVSPVHGFFYDWVGTEPSDRQRCYERIKSICASHDVPCADFSDKEYDEYFLHDIVHFGWTGWVAVEEAIYDYLKD